MVKIILPLFIFLVLFIISLPSNVLALGPVNPPDCSGYIIDYTGWIVKSEFEESYQPNTPIDFIIQFDLSKITDLNYKYFILASKPGTANFIRNTDIRSLGAFPIAPGNPRIRIRINSIPQNGVYQVKLRRGWGYLGNWFGFFEQEVCKLGEIEIKISAPIRPGSLSTVSTVSTATSIEIEQCITPSLPPATSTTPSTIAVASAGKLCRYNFSLGGKNFKSDSAGPGAPLKCGVATSIGCVPTEPEELIAAILLLCLSIGGAITFLLMLLGAFQMITSAGNPEVLKNGQERFYDAIIGFLFIIFSILLLRIIGADILQIPGF